MLNTKSGVLSFGSMSLIVGGLALAGLLYWGWRTGQDIPLVPALLVAAVNLYGAIKLVTEAKARRAAGQAAAAAAAAGAAQPRHKETGKGKH
jgi:hypothetical protein